MGEERKSGKIHELKSSVENSVKTKSHNTTDTNPYYYTTFFSSAKLSKCTNSKGRL